MSTSRKSNQSDRRVRLLDRFSDLTPFLLDSSYEINTFDLLCESEAFLSHFGYRECEDIINTVCDDDVRFHDDTEAGEELYNREEIIISAERGDELFVYCIDLDYIDFRSLLLDDLFPFILEQVRDKNNDGGHESHRDDFLRMLEESVHARETRVVPYSEEEERGQVNENLGVKPFGFINFEDCLKDK